MHIRFSQTSKEMIYLQLYLICYFLFNLMKICFFVLLYVIDLIAVFSVIYCEILRKPFLHKSRPRNENLTLAVRFAKNIRELSWMSHRVTRFWFLLIFLFISASFDILASLSISHVFSSGFPGRRKSSCLDIPRTIFKCDYLRFNLWGTFPSNNKYFSCQSNCLLLLLEVCKNHYRKENSVAGSE